MYVHDSGLGDCVLEGRDLEVNEQLQQLWGHRGVKQQAGSSLGRVLGPEVCGLVGFVLDAFHGDKKLGQGEFNVIDLKKLWFNMGTRSTGIKQGDSQCQTKEYEGRCHGWLCGWLEVSGSRGSLGGLGRL